jgi:DNA-binding NarL/FixJ family response regulator
VKVLLADDHPLFLDGLRTLLTSHGIEVLGAARDGIEAIEMARALKPELILMDIRMPRMDGVTAMRRIQAELPDTRIVMLTMLAGDDHLFTAMKSGACGYLLKTQDTDEFLSLLREAAEGAVVLSPGLATRILHEFGRTPAAGAGPVEPEGRPLLSQREIEVLALVAQGLTYKEVGARLFLTERTIKYHMGEIVARLNMANREEAVRYARRTGLVG